MPNQSSAYRFFGVIRYPATVRLRADTKNHAIIRAHFGEYDRIEKLLSGEGRFEMDPGQPVVEVQRLPKVRLYRAIFTETTSYAVDFSSNLPLRDLLIEDHWREELDNWNVSEGICWQAENAIHVEGCRLDHLEQLPTNGEKERERR